MRIINTALGFMVSIAVYKEYVSLAVAVLTGIYMIIQISLGIKKLINKKQSNGNAVN